MKKKYLIITLVVALIVALIISFVFNNNDNKKYYVINYSASYASKKLSLSNADYQIVTSVDIYNNILSSIDKNKYKGKFNNKFFEKNNLLVVDGGIDSELKKIEINDIVNIKIYHASPLSTKDDVFTQQLYLIPVDKSITDVSVDNRIYPDRIY